MKFEKSGDKIAHRVIHHFFIMVIELTGQFQKSLPL
jgi:hypothetical protein